MRRRCARWSGRRPVQKRPRHFVSPRSPPKIGLPKASSGSSPLRPAASSCTAHTTAPAFRQTASASRSKLRSPSAPAITARRAAASWRSTACASRCAAAGPRRAFSISAPALACSPSPPPGPCTGACWQPTSMRLRCAWHAPMRGSTASGRWSRLPRRAGVTAPAIRAQAPFDLVFANILLEPLQRLAAPLAKIVAPGGHVVLSGLLTAQANAALAAYRAFRLERRIVLDGWTTLVLKARQISRPRRCPMSAVPLDCSACSRRISSRSRIAARAATARRGWRRCGRS